MVILLIAMAYVGLAQHMCTPRGYLASLHVNGKGQGKPLPRSALHDAKHCHLWYKMRGQLNNKFLEIYCTLVLWASHTRLQSQTTTVDQRSSAVVFAD
jgi:hypothetical protein